MPIDKNSPNGIETRVIIVILLSMFMVVVFASIKIYLSNQIYYESKQVNKIKQEVSILKAEKEMIKQEVEALKFKNRVTDAIFTIEEEE